MDSHSRSASPREQPRPQQRPPSPPSPRLPPAAFDNKAYQHDDADPNHNESFTSNGAQQNGHNKEPNGDSKSVEAVNLELINLTPKNGSLKHKKDVEVDMNGSNPYDEYFVPVNEHRKYMRGEKLYVTADKRGEKGGCKRPLCWTLLALVVAAIIALIALAATGVIFSNSPTPVDPYNVSISSARALSGIGKSHDAIVHEHYQEQKDHNNDQNQEQHDPNNEQNQEQQERNNDQNQEQVQHIHDHDQNEQSPEQNQEHPNHVYEQENNEQNHGENHEGGQNDLGHEHKEVILDQNPEHDQNQEQDENRPDQEHKQYDQSQDQDMIHNNEQLKHGQNLDQNDQSNQQHNPEVHMPDTQNDERLLDAVVPVGNDMSMYVPRTVEGELKIDNEQFLEAYSDPESDEYRQFTESFKEALIRALFNRNTIEAGDNDINLEVIELRPGSVVVKYRINWRPKYETRPTEDLLNATTLQENLNNYLINNNRMINIYHVADDNLITKPVLDLCQINKNDCQDGCEFDESSLDFVCTCPQGMILNVHDLKTCVTYLFHPESKPIQEISDEVNKSTLTTTTANPNPPPVINYDSRVNWKGIDAETTTVDESELRSSSALDTHDKDRWDIETTPKQNPPNEGLENVRNPSPDMNISVSTESQDNVQSVPEMNSTIPPIGVPNTTNYNTYLKDDDMSESHKEKEKIMYLIPKPKVNQEIKEENVVEQHIYPATEINANNITKANTDLKPSQYETPSPSFYDLEPEAREGNSADATFNLDEALRTHQVIKPEEIYTEQPESTTSEENESNEKTYTLIEPELNVMSESNETLVSTEIANFSTTKSPEPHDSAEIMFDKDIKTSSPITTTEMLIPINNFQQDFKEIKDPSFEINLKEMSHEKDVSSGLSDTNVNNSKTETNIDDTDDWLTDTLPSDNKTIATIENSVTDTKILSPNFTGSENNSESRSFENFTNGSEVSIMSSNNALDMNTMVNILNVHNNATKNNEKDTDQNNPSAIAIYETEMNKSVLNPEEVISETRNNTILNNNKSKVYYDISSMLTDQKEQNLDEINLNEQEMTTQASENNSEIINRMPQDFLKTMDFFNEPHANDTHTNTNISDDGKYVTFDDINILLNRSSKSMENLTNIKEALETTTNKTLEFLNGPLKQNDSEWLSEPVTEINYNEGINAMDITETTESVKNKVDHIMTHVKDDYEPDYLNKPDDSVYMLDRDYESEDPRVKRVNIENKDVTITEFSKERSTETNLNWNAGSNTTSELSSTQTIVMNVASSTSSALSTTISDFIYNKSEKNMNDFSETAIETSKFRNSSPIPLQQDPISISEEFNNESNSETILTAPKETNLEPQEITTSTVFTPHSSEPLEITTSTVFTPHIDNNVTHIVEESESSKHNETQKGNLDVTIYEISHGTGNNSLSTSKSTNTQMSEYDDHETEMNPFLPESENNKNLVKKLQEGHDFEVTNMNETQNDNSDEHNFNNTEGHIIKNTVNNEKIIPSKYINEQMNIKTTTDNISLPETLNNENTLIKTSNISESSDSIKVVQEDKDNNVEVLPISTFLIDTDDLEANKISISTKSFKDSPHYMNSNNGNLSVVPITRDMEDDNSNGQSRYEINDISDTLKNTDKRTFDLSNYGDFTNNRS